MFECTRVLELPARGITRDGCLVQHQHIPEGTGYATCVDLLCAYTVVRGDWSGGLGPCDPASRAVEHVSVGPNGGCFGGVPGASGGVYVRAG